MPELTVNLDGRDREVFASANPESALSSVDCLPPHTARSKPFATIQQGENLHGSLRQDFYVVVDRPEETAYLVLWVGDTGSQAADDQARLYLASWSAADDYWDEDTGQLDWKAASAALLYAWIRYGADAGGTYDEACETCAASDLLTDEEVGRTFQSSLEGARLRLH